MFWSKFIHYLVFLDIFIYIFKMVIKNIYIALLPWQWYLWNRLVYPAIWKGLLIMYWDCLTCLYAMEYQERLWLRMKIN